MEHVAYAAEAKIESSHWWFVGRRRLFAMLIRQAGIPANAAVVDIGTGTGANLRLLNIGYSVLEGGIPIVADGKIIGSVGVSGVTSQQDAQIGQAGIDALK